MIREIVQRIVNTISAWEGITANPHRFGGVEFKLGSIEIGHIHSNGMVDIPFTRKLRETLVANGDAQPHHLLHDSGWITVFARTDAEADHALRLYRLSYLHKKYRKSADRDETFALETQALGFKGIQLYE